MRKFFLCTLIVLLNFPFSKAEERIQTYISDPPPSLYSTEASPFFTANNAFGDNRNAYNLGLRSLPDIDDGMTGGGDTGLGIVPVNDSYFILLFFLSFCYCYSIRKRRTKKEYSK